MRRTSKRSIIFPECSRISASASVTNSLCQSAEGLPGAELVGWGAWYQRKQKICSYIRLIKSKVFLLLRVLCYQLQLCCRYKPVPKQWPFRLFHPFCFLLPKEQNSPGLDFSTQYPSISTPVPIFQIKISACIWVCEPDFFLVAIIGQVIGNTVLSEWGRVPLIRSLQWFMSSLALQWNGTKKCLVPKFSMENRKRELRWSNSEWSPSLNVIIIKSKFSYGKTAMDLKAQFSWNNGAHGNFQVFRRNMFCSKHST